MTKINIEEIIIDKTNINSDESISDTDTDESDESEYVINDIEKDKIIKEVNIIENIIDNVIVNITGGKKIKEKENVIEKVNVIEKENVIHNVIEKENVVKNVIKNIIEKVEVEEVKVLEVEKVEKSTMTSLAGNSNMIRKNIKRNNLNTQRNNLNNTKQYSKPYNQYKPFCPKCKIRGHDRKNCPIKDEKKYINEMEIESITNKLGIIEIKLQKNIKAMQEMKDEYLKLTNEKTLLINNHDKLEKILLEKNRINDLYCDENINLTKASYANFYKINVDDITLEEIISSSAGFRGWFETTLKHKNNL